MICTVCDVWYDPQSGCDHRVLLADNELLVEMFGQEDTVSAEFFDKADTELVEKIIKETIIRKAKQENYQPITEPVISVHKYLKKIGERFMPVPYKADADLIVLHTTVKVVKAVQL